MADEIYQISPLNDIELSSINAFVEELNVRLLTISNKIPNVLNFTGRTPIESHDFTLSDFTTDGSWHDLDLSFLPSNVKLGLISIELEDDVADSLFQLKAADEDDAINVLSINTQVANIPIYTEGLIDISNYRRVKYQADNLTFSAINLTIRGYWA